MMGKRCRPQIRGQGAQDDAQGSVRSRRCLVLGTSLDGQGQSAGRLGGGGGGGERAARATVLLIAPFAFKEIKLFLVRALLVRRWRKPFHRRDFLEAAKCGLQLDSGSLPEGAGGDLTVLGAVGTGQCTVAPQGPLLRRLPGLGSPGPRRTAI